MRITHHPRAAFTLVELLLATAITALIVVMLGTMFGSLTTTSLRANQRIDAFRDARAALQMIERDLSGLVRNQRDAAGNPLTLPAAYFVLDDLYDDPSAGNHQIYALIAAKNTGAGDLCAVGYYIRWDSQRNAYSLYRYFDPSGLTFAHLTSPSVIGAGYASKSDLYSPEASSVVPPVKDEVLASFAWNLRVTAYDKLGNILPAAYPLICDSSAASNDPLPAVIEVSFKAISANAARALISTGAQSDVWMTPANTLHQRLIAPHAYEFRTRIEL